MQQSVLLNCYWMYSKLLIGISLLHRGRERTAFRLSGTRIECFTLLRYNSLMTSSRSSLLKQVVGGTIGMLVASVLYIAVQFGPQNAAVPALLIADVPQANQAQVRVNNKNVDDQTLRRITQRAQSVAAADAQGPSVSQTDETARTTDDATARRRASVDRYASLTQPENASPRSEERVLQRAEKRIALARERDTIVATASQGAVHTGAPLTQTGTATNVLLLASLLIAGGYAVRRRLVKTEC